MLIPNFLRYKHWNPCWVYIIPILTPLVKYFHLDIINLAKQHNNISIVNEMKNINKRLKKNITWNKIKTLQKYKKEIKNMILIWTTKMLKCMANTSFYKPKFETIDLMTNC